MQNQKTGRVTGRSSNGALADLRRWSAASAAALLAPLGAQAFSCDLPAQDQPQAPASRPATEAGKFSLAQQHCTGLAAASSEASPVPAPRSAQLALYERGPVSLRFVDGPAVARPVPAALKPPRGDGLLRSSAPQTQRIVGLAPTLSAAAQRHDIDPLLLHAIAHVESRHNTQAISPAGARGVMQVMPATARRFGLSDPQRELLQAPLNVEVSAAYLKTLQARFGNDLPLVLAAYNAGEGAVERHKRRIPPYAETRAYVKQVLGAYEALRELMAGGSAGTPAGGAR